ncbi:hypothetical protein KUCAC02_035856, partial [Chaenocephalus aceratus]
APPAAPASRTFDEEEADEQPRKRKLFLWITETTTRALGLDGAEMPGPKGGVNTEEKRKHIKKPHREKSPLPDRSCSPTRWTGHGRLEEEATLVEFVCSKVMAHSTPQGILDDVAMVLDEEAEVFI